MSEIITSTEQEILIAHMVDRLPALRKKYGISQTELGEKIGLSRQTISAIERKTTPLTWTTMLAILMFLLPTVIVYSIFLKEPSSGT